MPVPPVIGRWLREANDRLGTRLIAAAPTEVEETIRIEGLPTRVKFNSGTMLGRIEAPQSVLGEMEPGLVSDLVHTTFMLNPTLWAVLIHLNSADVTSLLAGILPHVPKPKDKAKGKEPTSRAQEDVVYWIGEDADDCVVFASTKPSPSEMTRRAFGSAPIGHKERVLPASKTDTFPVRSLATNSGLAFADPVEGITTPSHMAGKIVALPRQCPLLWVGMGDPPMVGVSASEFTFNEDPSKLDGAAHLLWKGVVPMEMLDKVMEALGTRPCDTWDPVFNDFPGVHRGPDSGNRMMFALRLPHVDVGGSGVGYHECEALMSFTNHVVGLFNNTWSGDHKVYQAAAIGAKGREMQSYHRDMMKVPDGKRVVSVFAALDEDEDSVDGTDTVFLPHSRDVLPRPWDPIPIPLRRGDLFVLYSDLVHAGGCTPLSKPASWWRRVLFLSIATVPVTYSYTVGIHVPFWGLEESRVDGPERCTISGCRRKAAKDCFSCGMPRLCATHEGELCPACSRFSFGSKASAAASAPGAGVSSRGHLLASRPDLHTAPCLAPPASTPSQHFSTR